MQKPEGEYPLKSSSKNLSIDNQSVLIGRIISVHGFKGTVKVHSFSESLSLYNSISKILLKVPGNVELITMKVLWARPYKRWVYLRLENKQGMTKTNLLVNSNIYIEKATLPPLEEDTYFWSDLIGMSVKSVLGEVFGCINSIIPTGSNDVYVVNSSKTGAIHSEILIPAIQSVVLDVNLSTRLMVVDLPEGIRSERC